MGHLQRPSIRKLLLEERHHRSIRTQDITKTGGDEAGMELGMIVFQVFIKGQHVHLCCTLGGSAGFTETAYTIPPIIPETVVTAPVSSELFINIAF